MTKKRKRHRALWAFLGWLVLLILVVVAVVLLWSLIMVLRYPDANVAHAAAASHQYLPLAQRIIICRPPAFKVGNGCLIQPPPPPPATPTPPPTPISEATPASVESCPSQLQIWTVIDDPANGEVVIFDQPDHTAWCSRIWIESDAITISGAGWCDDYGCAPSCRDGYCVSGLSPWMDKIELWWEPDIAPVDRFEVYSLRGRPTPAPTMEP